MVGKSSTEGVVVSNFLAEDRYYMVFLDIMVAKPSYKDYHDPLSFVCIPTMCPLISILCPFS
jgi:hypothetical protein